MSKGAIMIIGIGVLLPLFPIAQSKLDNRPDTLKTQAFKSSTGKTGNPLIGEKLVYKTDTLGPIWKQISDTTPGYNPVMAMHLYEVVGYDRGDKDCMNCPLLQIHLAWLDINKKLLKLKVWRDKE